MYYYILGNQVIAKYATAEEALNHKQSLVESDDETIEPYQDCHIDGKFVKGSTYVKDSLALLLKLAKPSDPVDVALQSDLLKKLGEK